MISRAAAATTTPVALADLWALTKPRITLMVLVTTAGGMWLAGHPSAVRVALTLVGTALVVAGANTLNMYLERDIDGRMRRTRDRPLPAGRLRPSIALGMGLGFGVVSVPVLLAGANALTAALGLFSLVVYVWVYTPMKQRSPMALLVGAVPGAMPPLMGWTSATGALQWPGLVLFAMLWLWQVPHFLAITLFRTDDYAGAGFEILAAQRGARTARIHAAIYLAALLAASLLLSPAGAGRGPYLAIAATLGGALLGWGLLGLRRDVGARWARGLFAGTLLYLIGLFAAIAATSRH